MPLPGNFLLCCSDSMTQTPVAVAENNFHPESLCNHIAGAVSDVSIGCSKNA